ncbi:hypothetical protein GCM10010340_59630 [Streptomyces griseoloalbus]|nr:hypothetical protein GCM10010340_59630 [Streptomyces albaduncus]
MARAGRRAALCPPRATCDRPCDPEARRGRGGCETCRMPVLDPNPQNGQKKMLLVFGAFFAIFIVIGVVATILAP